MRFCQTSLAIGRHGSLVKQMSMQNRLFSPVEA